MPIGSSRLALWLTAGIVACSAAQAQGQVTLSLRIAGGGSQFRPGEIIPIELTFDSSIRNRFVVDAATRDRGGWLAIDEFTLAPLAGVTGPMLDYFAATGGFAVGGQSGMGPLGTKPFTVRLTLNGRYRFETPGTFTLSVRSSRVTDELAGTSNSRSIVEVDSDEVSFEILARDERWEDAEIARALAKLSEPGPSNDPEEGCRMLAFLGTNAAVDEMIRRHDEGSHCRYHLNTAMFHARDRDYAVGRLEAGLRASDQVVTDGYLRTLALLSLYARHPELRAAQTPETKGRPIAGGALSRRRDLIEAEEAKYAEVLASALSSKIGRARAISTQEHLSFTRNRGSAQLIAVFANLPESRQANLLESGWQELAHADMLPLLRELADGSGRLADLALRRFYELAPEEGRWRLLDQIRRPPPNATLTTLGVLPDATLPAFDEDIARGIEKEISDIGLGLLHRYASAAVARRLLPRLAGLVGRTACRPQSYALAYLLRVDPRQGAPLLDRALASRSVTGCFQSVLLDTATLHMTPELEDAAIARLDDRHPRVVLNAVETLGRFGSPGAADSLRNHFQTWHRAWRGRASELRYNAARGGADQPGAVNAMIEVAYVRALAARPGAVSADELRSLCLTDGCRGAVQAAFDRTK